MKQDKDKPSEELLRKRFEEFDWDDINPERISLDDHALLQSFYDGLKEETGSNGSKEEVSSVNEDSANKITIEDLESLFKEGKSDDIKILAFELYIEKHHFEFEDLNDIIDFVASFDVKSQIVGALYLKNKPSNDEVVIEILSGFANETDVKSILGEFRHTVKNPWVDYSFEAQSAQLPSPVLEEVSSTQNFESRNR